MQTLGHLPARAPMGSSLEDRLKNARRILSTYTYAVVVATWDGTYKDEPGLYFVLEGGAHAIGSTFDLLASGLYFATRLRDLG